MAAPRTYHVPAASEAAGVSLGKADEASLRGGLTLKRHLMSTLLVLILGCLVGVVWLTYGNLRAEMASGREERHTREVIHQLDNLLSSLKDTETGQRGFIITGTRNYLEPYQAGLADTANSLADLHHLTADNPQLQQRLEAITPLVMAKLKELKESIALRETQGLEAAIAMVATQSGKQIMDKIRALVGEARAQEAQLLKVRVATHATDNRRIMQSVTWGGVLTGLGLLLLFIRLRWAQASRQRAHELASRQAVELTTLYLTAPVGLFVYDTDLRYVRVNPVMAELNGLPVEQHVGRTLRELLTPELADAVEPQVRQVLETGQPLLNCEVHGTTFPRSSEQQRHWLVSYHPVQLEDGTIGGVHGAAQEITERKQAELAQARLAMIVESSDDAIISKSINGVIQTWNAGAERMFGYSAEEIVGKPITVLVPLDRLPEEECILQQLRLGKAIENYETLRLTKDGRHIDVSLTTSPMKDADGKVVGASKIIRNITARKQAETALRESEARFRSIMQQSHAGIVQTDATGCLTSMNDSWCKMLGYPEAEMAGRSLLELTHPSCVEATATAFGALAAGGPDFQIDKQYTRKDGTILGAQSNVSAVRSPSGDFLGIIAVVVDMTERLRIEDALRESEKRQKLATEIAVTANQAKSDFLSTISHEIRTPLNGMLGMTELLLTGNLTLQQRQYAELAQTSGKTLLALVNDLLDIGKIEAGQLVVENVPFSLTELLSELTDIYSLRAQEKSLVFLAKKTSNVPNELLGDPGHLRQILNNLLANALKFTWSA